MPIFTVRGLIPLTVAPAAIAWNPADKDANVTLSNGNLTANETASANSSVRATRAVSSSLIYCEFVLDARGFSPYVGFGDLSAPLNTTNLGGDFPTHSFGFNFNNGLLQFSGATNSCIALGGGTAGTVVGMAFNMTLNKVWCTIDGTNWNPAGTGGNPGTNTNGIDVTPGGGGGPFSYPMCELSNTGDQITWRPTGPFSFTVPSGYSAP